MKKTKRTTNFIIATSICLLSAAPTAQAASSKWQDLYGGQARLSAVKDPETNVISGYVEIELKDGWTTYWKHPAGTGIPPELDFSQSKHFVLEKIEYPTPKLITYEGGSFLGYKNTVRFLFTGTALRQDAAVNLNMLAGVCEEICIPAEASFKVEARSLNQSDPRTSSTLMLARSYLPSKVRDNFMLDDLKFSDQEISAVLKTPKATSGATGTENAPIMLIEGPNNWFSGVIKPSGNKIVYKLPDTLTSIKGWKEQLTYTLIANGEGVSSALK